jgi:2-polyprenyl-3-methyl-5-hydroxy-6-metoxy-1,4-benzoquinol methylase
MDPKAMGPYGAVLLSYFAGNTGATLILHRDDGQEAQLPVSHFFRRPSTFTPIEIVAIERCSGHVLDLGAGTGLHSLALQQTGIRVTAIDINPQAVEIMAHQGVQDVHCAHLFEFQGDPLVPY